MMIVMYVSSVTFANISVLYRFLKRNIDTSLVVRAPVCGELSVFILLKITVRFV